MHFAPVPFSRYPNPRLNKLGFDGLSPLEILFSLRSRPIADLLSTRAWMKLLSVADIEYVEKGTKMRSGTSPNAPCFLLVEGAACLKREGDVARQRSIKSGEFFFNSHDAVPQIVEMTRDCTVLRIEKQEYTSLLEPCLVQFVNAQAAQHDLATSSNVRVLDVRDQSEFQYTHIPNAINMPLEDLYKNVSALNPYMDWIIVSNVQTRASEAAAFLIQHGFLARVLEQGMASWPYLRHGTDIGLELISLDYCPYAQRSQIMLLHGGIPCKITYIEPGEKPDWFKKISPLGKVPVLRVGSDRVVFESNVINEYIRSLGFDPMLPEDPVDRARCRSWIEFASTCQGGILKMVSAQSKQDYDTALADLARNLAYVEEQVDPTGPWFTGSRFSQVDATYAPVFLRLVYLAKVAEVPRLSRKLQAWSDAVLSHAAVEASTPSHFQEVFKGFVDVKGEGGYVHRLMNKEKGDTVAAL